MIIKIPEPARTKNPIRDTVCRTSIELVDGYAMVLNWLELGIEIDEDVTDHYILAGPTCVNQGGAARCSEWASGYIRTDSRSIS